jgi:hypothetical protein
MSKKLTFRIGTVAPQIGTRNLADRYSWCKAATGMPESEMHVSALQWPMVVTFPANPLTHRRAHRIVPYYHQAWNREDVMGARMREFRQCSASVKRIVHLACSALVVLATTGALSNQATARPLFPAEERFFAYRGVLPRCDDPAVFGRIQTLFYQREAEFWKSGLAITGFDRAHESAIAAMASTTFRDVIVSPKHS